MKTCTLILLGLSAILKGIQTTYVPVFKTTLQQDRVKQYLQFDISGTPPMSEFTLCIWVRANDLQRDQVIFLYKVKKNLAIRLWLDSGGRSIVVAIDGETWSNPVNFTLNTWQHLCISYQSDFGALAQYVAGKLTGCTTNKNLLGYVLPGGGSFVIGRGSQKYGLPNGLEGEVFGFNLILKSTIERNQTITTTPNFPFATEKIKNKQKNTDFADELKDLQTSELQSKNITLPHFPNKSQSFIQITTPSSFIEHDVGIKPTATFRRPNGSNNNGQIISNYELDRTRSKPEMYNIWSHAHKHSEIGKLNTESKDLSDSETEGLPLLSDFEVPPPPGPPYSYVSSEHITKIPITSTTETEDNTKEVYSTVNTLSEVEKPPPLERDKNVHRTWTSSMFAGRVLNYLKSISFGNRDQRWVPQTIPLNKVSDVYPYGSGYIVNKMKPQYEFIQSLERRKREINVKIIEEDLRSEILKQHAQNQPKHVEITNRGENHRFYRNIYTSSTSSELLEKHEKDISPRPFTRTSHLKKHTTPLRNHNFSSSQDFSLRRPFIEPSKYLLEKPQANAFYMYVNSLANNKWHNVQSYNKLHTPKEIHSNLENNKNSDTKNNNANGNNTSHPEYVNKSEVEDRDVQKPKSTESKSIERKINYQTQSNTNERIQMTQPGNNFDKHVKIGNALNELQIIGYNIDEKTKSFVGGNDLIPDINKYRSDLDKEDEKLLASLDMNFCDGDIYGTMLYVKTDGSIEADNFQSISITNNLGIQFISHSYMKCSWVESPLADSPLFLINWSYTRIKLFGGAIQKQASDLCGFQVK